VRQLVIKVLNKTKLLNGKNAYFRSRVCVRSYHVHYMLAPAF